MSVIDIKRLSATRKLPKSVKKFFIDFYHEEFNKINPNDFAESVNINVNLCLTEARIEMRTSTYDRSKSYLEQLDLGEI